MKFFIILMTLRVFSLIGGILNTIGFMTFFFWESLVPYRWNMIIGGVLLTAVSELICYLYAKKIINEPDSDGEDEFE